MALSHQVFTNTDIDAVYAFAEKRLAQEIPDETDRIFRSWEVRWRREALEHYAKLGWSFVCYENDPNRKPETNPEVVGFFLAQPLLFFRGNTQSLWIEHVEARDDEVEKTLVEIATGVAREKNLQRVLTSEPNLFKQLAARYKPEPLQDGLFEIRTTKG